MQSLMTEPLPANAGPFSSSSAFSDTRWKAWGVQTRADEFEVPSDDSHSDIEARYILPSRKPVQVEDELLAPEDLLAAPSSSTTATMPINVPENNCTRGRPSPSPSRALASSLPSPHPTTAPRMSALSIQRKKQDDAIVVVTPALPRPVPMPPVTDVQGVVPDPSRSPLSSGDSSDETSGSASSGASSRRPGRRFSRLCKSPDGPKFASGSYKNSPSPAALPPPPPTFCASPPLRRTASTAAPLPLVLPPSPSPPAQPVAQPRATCRLLSSSTPAALYDPAIIAAVLPPAPTVPAPKPVDQLAEMTSQLCQLLKIRA